MAEILQISQLGNPVLRRRSQVVENIKDDRIQQLIDSLICTVQQANGVGIAAPQAAQSDRLFIVASRPNLRYPQAPNMEPTAMINPRIVASINRDSQRLGRLFEHSGIRGLVPRSRAIEIEYTSRDGKLHRQELTDFVARIFQHEHDHLDGIVFLDRVENTHELMTEDEYQQQFVKLL
jgi:peptide deformylase